MRSYAVLLSLLSLALLTTAAPTPPPDAATLLANAQEAQRLNTEFQQLNATDPCTDGETACVDGAQATCVNSAWQLEQCPQNLQCFALPSVRRPGTITACTSEAIAVSLIEGLGAEGGATGSDPVDPNAGGDPNAATVTVTVTLSPTDLEATPTVTLEPTTQTLDPSAAAAAVGQTDAPTITLNLPSITPSIAANVGGVPEPPAGSGTTIMLTTTPIAAAAATPAPETTSAPAADPPAAAAAAPTTAADPGYGYGGY